MGQMDPTKAADQITRLLSSGKSISWIVLNRPDLQLGLEVYRKSRLSAEEAAETIRALQARGWNLYKIMAAYPILEDGVALITSDQSAPRGSGPAIAGYRHSVRSSQH